MDKLAAQGSPNDEEGVREILERSAAFQTLDPYTRDQMARDLSTVLSVFGDKGSGLALARAQAGSGSGEKKPRPLRPGEGFTAGALREGVDQFTRLRDEVDFTEFVSGLIEGVFTSIVDSSIRQMEAYAKLLESVVASVQDFADENVSEDSARNYVQDRFPKALQKVQTEAGSRLQINPDLDDEQLPDFKSEFGIDVGSDLDDEAVEAQLVNAAKLKMARLKQQQLATMVLMGINRIIVTNGEINASVQFDFKSEDRAIVTDVKHGEKGSETTREREGQLTTDSESKWSGKRDDRDHEYSGSSKGQYKGTSKLKTTVSSKFTRDLNKESESKIEASAKLMGAVKLKFRSETFPLDRINPANMSIIQDRASEEAK